MHLHHIFLFRVAQALHQRCKNGYITQCFSQNKDELYLSIETDAAEPFWIRISAQASNPFICFPEQFTPARNNRAELFKDIIGKQLLEIRSYHNERMISMLLEDEYRLVVKLFATKSNILLYHQGKVVEIFRKKMTDDYLFDLQQYALAEARNSLNDLYLGKPIEQHCKDKNIPEHELLTQLYHGDVHVHIDAEVPKLSLLPQPNPIFSSPDPLLSSTFFVKSFLKIGQLSLLKKQFLNWLTNRFQQTETYIHKSEQRLSELKDQESYEHIGHILMANLHTLPQGLDSVVLDNFYTNTPIHIKLKPDTSPVENAAYYYKKAKKQHIEIENIQHQLAAKMDMLTHLYSVQDKVHAVSDQLELKSLYKLVQYTVNTPQASELSLPYNLYIYKEYQILVGKQAKHNDELTFGIAKKNDLWLHARSVSGSHVIIKSKGTQTIPKDVIEHAASLAAKFSKSKNETVCPVSYTYRKYIRKPKGAKPGAVIMEREEVIMVPPAR